MPGARQSGTANAAQREFVRDGTAICFFCAGIVCGIGREDGTGTSAPFVSFLPHAAISRPVLSARKNPSFNWTRDQ